MKRDNRKDINHSHSSLKINMNLDLTYLKCHRDQRQNEGLQPHLTKSIAYAIVE